MMLFADLYDDPTDAKVEVGDYFRGWSKKWEVVAVMNGTAKIVDVEADYRTMTLPLSQFKARPN